MGMESSNILFFLRGNTWEYPLSEIKQDSHGLEKTTTFLRELEHLGMGMNKTQGFAAAILRDRNGTPLVKKGNIQRQMFDVKKKNYLFFSKWTASWK